MCGEGGPDGSLMSRSGPWLLREGEEINDKVKREVSTDLALLYFGAAVITLRVLQLLFLKNRLSLNRLCC